MSSNRQITLGLKTKLLSNEENSEAVCIATPTPPPPSHTTSPLQLAANQKFLADLAEHVSLLESSLSTMKRLTKSHSSKIDDSYFAHIKSSQSDVLNHSIMRAQIKNELEAKPAHLQAYRDFDQALNNLIKAQNYFKKKPFCEDKAFKNSYEFHKKQYDSQKSDISKIIDNCKSYHGFVANVVKICDGTVPAPAQLLA